MLKDITHEVDDLLEWRVLLSDGEDDEAVARFVKELESPDCFTLAKPDHRPPVRTG